MTKEVVVTIIGTQKETGEEPIKVSAPGAYHYTNGKHYVQYDEKLEHSSQTSKNLLKIGSTQVSLSKKLHQTSQMVFDLRETTQTVYATPYGDLNFDVTTASILLTEDPDKIEVLLNYTLSADASKVSENSITIIIEAVS